MKRLNCWKRLLLFVRGCATLSQLAFFWENDWNFQESWLGKQGALTTIQNTILLGRLKSVMDTVVGHGWKFLRGNPDLINNVYKIQNTTFSANEIQWNAWAFAGGSCYECWVRLLCCSWLPRSKNDWNFLQGKNSWIGKTKQHEIQNTTVIRQPKFCQWNVRAFRAAVAMSQWLARRFIALRWDKKASRLSREGCQRFLSCRPQRSV